MDYRSKAIQCVKDTVLPLQRRQFEACGCSLDAQYKTYGRSEGFFAAVLEPGRVYEMGYPRCVCPEVLQGTVTLLAGLLAPVFSQEVISNLSFLGSILIFCVGVNLAFGPRFRVANMLPALVIGGLYTALL